MIRMCISPEQSYINISIFRRTQAHVATSRDNGLGIAQMSALF